MNWLAKTTVCSGRREPLRAHPALDRRLGPAATRAASLVLCLAHPDPAHGSGLGGVLPPHATPAARRAWAVHQSGLCLVAIRAAELHYRLPSGSLAAISRVETGRHMPVTGDMQPWPWTVNAFGTGYWFDTRAEAARATAIFLARPGGGDVDIGCMQVSMRYHRRAFATLSDALDPEANVDVGARLLAHLSATRGLPAATGLYHSATPAYGDPYRRGVAGMRATQRNTLANAHGTGGEAAVP